MNSIAQSVLFLDVTEVLNQNFFQSQKKGEKKNLRTLAFTIRLHFQQFMGIQGFSSLLQTEEMKTAVVLPKEMNILG